MKLVTFSHNNNLSIGAVKDDLIISFAQSSLPKNMIDFIELGNDGLDTANDLIEKGEDKNNTRLSSAISFNCFHSVTVNEVLLKYSNLGSSLK